MGVFAILQVRNNARLSPGLYFIANLLLVAVLLIQLSPAHSEGEVVPPPRLGIPLEGEMIFWPGLDPLGQPWTGGDVRLVDCPSRNVLAPEPPSLPPLRLLDPPGRDVPLARIWYGLPTNQKVVAITIDDAPIRTTQALLDVLREKGVKATWFVDGQRGKANPGLMRKIVNEGHELANHTWSHPWLTWMDKEQVRHDIMAADLALRGIGVPVRRWLRPPYGDHNRWLQAICHELNYEIMMWSMDSLDWRLTSEEEILAHTLSQLRPGGIVLFHDGSAATPGAMAAFIDEARARGYRFVLISEYIK